MKRILAILLVLAMVFCLFACGEQEIEKSKKKPTSTASNPTTGITVPTTQPIEEEKIQETIAIQLGDYKLSTTEVNYFYVDAINRYVEQYYYYIYLGYIRLDLNTPLNQQYVDVATTWADSFMDMAVENIKSTYGLYDLAMKNDYTLNCDETAELTGLESYLRNQAEDLGYRNVDQMLRDTYGSGATLSSYMEYYTICTYASSYYTAYEEALMYDAETLRAYEGAESYRYNSYSYSYYFVNVDSFVESDYPTTEQKTEAERACKAFADQLAAGKYDTQFEFDFAIDYAMKELNGEWNGAEEDEKPKYSSVVKNDELYGSINSMFKNWIVGKSDDENTNLEVRNKGDMTVIECLTGTGDSKIIKGYYVVRFESCTDNAFALANVRHILIKFEGGSYNATTGQTTYTDAEKNAAKTVAEKLYNGFKAGTTSEDAFANLAMEHTDDSNGDNGGLYENVYPGQMVTSFNDWCFAKGDYADEAPRKAGDHGLVETEYGWHLMFYVGDSEITYRDYMVSNDKRVEDMESWYENVKESLNWTTVDLSNVPMDLVINGEDSIWDKIFG